jgi:uncharacterized protein (PEP-CTERM system associated)
LRATATTRDTGTATATAHPPRRSAGRALPGRARAAVLCATLLGSAAGASAQGLFDSGYPIEKPGLHAGVRASATWSDNVRSSSRGGDSDIVLEVSPYIVAESNAPRAKYRLFYQIRNFARLGDGDVNFFRHALNANGSFALVDDRLGVDLTGFMGTIGASPTGPISADPASSFTNTANVRHFSVSPWYRDTLGRLANYQLRYTLAHSGGNSSFTTADLSHTASAQVDGIPSAGSKWNWGWSGQMQRQEYNNDLTRDRRLSSFALYYSIYPSLRVYGTADYEYIEGLRDRDGDDHGWGPGAGFDWTPFQRTNIDGYISKRFYGTVGNLGVSHTMHRATMGLRYSRSVLTSADASLLMFDPSSLTSGGFGPQAGVNPIISNLLSAGILLPPGSLLTQTMFTDAAVLDRRLTAFWGISGTRNSLTFTGFFSNRESTTQLQTGTQFTGIRGSATFGGIFVGEIRERGLVASYARRLDGRSSADFTVDRRRLHSPTAFFETQYTTFRIGYTTWITSDLAGFAGVRRTIQSGEGRSSSYDENAIYAGVDLRFF